MLGKRIYEQAIRQVILSWDSNYYQPKVFPFTQDFKQIIRLLLQIYIILYFYFQQLTNNMKERNIGMPKKNIICQVSSAQNQTKPAKNVDNIPIPSSKQSENGIKKIDNEKPKKKRSHTMVYQDEDDVDIKDFNFNTLKLDFSHSYFAGLSSAREEALNIKQNIPLKLNTQRLKTLGQEPKKYDDLQPQKRKNELSFLKPPKKLSAQIPQQQKEQLEEIYSLRLQLQSTIHQCSRFQTDIGKLEESLKRQREQKQKFQKLSVELKRQRQNFQKQLDSSERTNIKLKKYVKELQEKIQQLHQNLQKREKQLKQQIVPLQKDNILEKRPVDREIKQLRQKYCKLEQENKKLLSNEQKNNQKQEKKIKEIQNKFHLQKEKEVQQLKEQIMLLKDQNSQIKNQQNKNQTQLKEVRAQIKQIQQQRLKYQQTSNALQKEIVEKNIIIDDLMAQIKNNKDKSNQKLQESKDDASIQKRREQIFDNFEDFEREINNKKEQIIRINERAAKERTISKKESQEYKKRIALLQKELAKKDQQILKQSQTVNDLTKKAKNTKLQVQKSNDALRKQFDKLKAELKQMKEQCKQKQQLISELLTGGA